MTHGVGSPLMWSGFILVVLLLLAFDLGVLHRRAHAVGAREALLWSVAWIALSLSFGFGVQIAPYGMNEGLCTPLDSHPKLQRSQDRCASRSQRRYGGFRHQATKGEANRDWSNSAIFLSERQEGCPKEGGAYVWGDPTSQHQIDECRKSVEKRTPRLQCQIFKVLWFEAIPSTR